MRKPGKNQISVLKRLYHSPQPLKEFGSRKNVLRSLQGKGWIQVNEDLASITDQGKNVFQIFEIKIPSPEEFDVKPEDRNDFEILDNQADLLEEKYPGLFDPLIELYREKRDALDPEEIKKIRKALSTLTSKNSNHAELVHMTYEGYSNQQIGDQFGISRERVRQLINRYEGYYTLVGTKEWCLRELERLVDLEVQPRIFPANEVLRAHHTKLEGFIKEHFTTAKKFGKLSDKYRLEVVKNLGFDVLEEIKTHTTWSEERGDL